MALPALIGRVLNVLHEMGEATTGQLPAPCALSPARMPSNWSSAVSRVATWWIRKRRRLSSPHRAGSISCTGRPWFLQMDMCAVQGVWMSH